MVGNISSYRSPPNLCHEGYIYNIYSTNRAQREKWRCGRRKEHCKGRIAVHPDGLVQLEHDHNHGPEPSEKIEKAHRRIRKLSLSPRPVFSKNTAVQSCFLCRSTIPISSSQADATGTFFQGDADKHDNSSDSFAVLQILIDMYDYKSPAESVNSFNRKSIAFCVRCANSLIQWNEILKEVVDLQRLMEDRLKEMTSLQQSVEQIFRACHSKKDSLQGKLGDCLGLKRKNKRGRPRAAGQVRTATKTSGITKSNPATKQFVRIKVEVPESMDSEHIQSEDDSVEALPTEMRQTRGSLRKLSAKTYIVDSPEDVEIVHTSGDEDTGDADFHAYSDSDNPSCGEPDVIEKLLEPEETVKSLSIAKKQSSQKIRSNAERSISRPQQRNENSNANTDQNTDSSDAVRESVSYKDRENAEVTSVGEPTAERSGPPRKSVYEQELEVDRTPDGRMFIRTIPILRKGEKYKCSICKDEMYDTLEKVKDHLRDAHEETLQKHRWREFQAPHQSKTYLKRQTTKQDGSIWYDSIEILRVGDYFQCSVCRNVMYTSKDSAFTHVRSKHSGDKSRECSLCGRNLMNNASLKIHMKTHVLSKAYTCEICGRSFKSDQSLRGHHRLIHSAELKLSTRFTCEYCGKQFAFRRDCIVHARSHTSEKPFSCDICDQSFKVRALLNRHLRNKHGKDLVYKCKHCNEVFTNVSNFCSHVATHFPETESIQPRVANLQLVTSDSSETLL